MTPREVYKLAYGDDTLFYEQNLRQELKRLGQRGLIKQKLDGPKIKIEVTNKGKTYLKRRIIKDCSIEKPVSWDGKWRIVAFDIPESKAKIRDAFRRNIRNMGFLQVQKSLWVYPYPCLKYLDNLINEYRVRSYVSLIEGRFIGKDGVLKKLFKLN